MTFVPLGLISLFDIGTFKSQITTEKFTVECEYIQVVFFLSYATLAD